jgi:hypothetical protein
MKKAIQYCLCGCRETVPGTRLYRHGHDARFKALLNDVVSGKRPAKDIPQAAIDRHNEIKFLTLPKYSHLAVAFTLPR